MRAQSFGCVSFGFEMRIERVGDSWRGTLRQVEAEEWISVGLFEDAESAREETLNVAKLLTDVPVRTSALSAANHLPWTPLLHRFEH